MKASANVYPDTEAILGRVASVHRRVNAAKEDPVLNLDKNATMV